MTRYLPPDGSWRLVEFCEWTPDEHDLRDGKPPLKGEMWLSVNDQPTVAGAWQVTAERNGFAMVECDPIELAAPIYPKAMINIVRLEDCDT